MKKLLLTIAAGAMTVPAVSMAAVPTQAPAATTSSSAFAGFVNASTFADERASLDRRDRRDRRYRGRGYDRNDRNYGGRYREGRYDQRVDRDTRVWRARDGRYYCQRDDGTTGLLIGGAVGGLIGNEIAGRGDKLLGTILGAAGGALLGREIDRDKYRCR